MRRRRALVKRPPRNVSSNTGPTGFPSRQGAAPSCVSSSHFHNILIYVLLASAVITAVHAAFTIDTAVILAVVIANAVIGFIQEGKAEKAMESIRKMLAPQAAVLRDGERSLDRRGETGSRRHRPAGGGRQGSCRHAADPHLRSADPGSDPDRRIRARRQGDRAGAGRCRARRPLLHGLQRYDGDQRTRPRPGRRYRREHRDRPDQRSCSPTSKCSRRRSCAR
jgi:hypothetical protein